MRKTTIIPLFLLALCLQGCAGFLDERPARNIAVPETAREIRALLNNEGVFNQTPVLQTVAADEYRTTRAGWQAFNTVHIQRAHLREFGTMFEGVENVTEWNLPYTQVFYANIALRQAELHLSPRDAGEQVALDDIVGAAKFCRAYALFHLLLNYAGQYHPATASSLRGIPLPQDPDVNVTAEISTLGEGYARVYADLEEAVRLLDPLPKFKSQPSRQAAHALLARVSLTAGEYGRALEHATAAIILGGRLLDFNTLNPNVNFPIPLTNEEVIYHSVSMNFTAFVNNPQTDIDPGLLVQYGEHDLRRSLYFVSRDGVRTNFRGSFSGGSQLFSGLSVGEMYLIAAECKARLGDYAGAASELNTLLESRHREGTFIPLDPMEGEEMLGLVLAERKKELVFRGLRWSDIKRLAGTSQEAGSLVRDLDGEVSLFLPGPENTAFPIPDAEMGLR